MGQIAAKVSKAGLAGYIVSFPIPEVVMGINSFMLGAQSVNPNFKIKKHSTLAEYRAALGNEQFRSLYKFTCVRNPWDRMVSFYFTPTQSPETWDRDKFQKIISEARSVADYLRLDQGKEDPFADVDYVMRFENLADDFRAVCDDLDIPVQPLPQYNRSTRQHYSEYYDDELRELVWMRFAPEIERFDYTFEQG